MSLQLPRFQNKKSSLEQEREIFEKGQATCLSKAINNQESAVKEKHVRSAIIGTYQERGAATFWDCVLRLPLKENGIVCWKFCHVLHKVLQEGHDNVLKDSQRYKSTLLDYGRFWGHLKAGYGGLVKIYCNLLNLKLNFHMRNNRIPGNLEMNDQELRQCAADSDDAFFQLSVEMFDYLDAILELQSEIFKTMDSARCNSMTNSGQCRLKPLISCIQDSMLLYDYTTKILFILHAKLSQDLLLGHRQRFEKVFRGLQKFYEKTMSLQYFRNLIEIQHLPKNPPNFLMQSDLENYETRKVTIYNSERDVTDGQSETHSDTLSDLVDLVQDSNGSSSPDPVLMAVTREKDRRIKELEDEIERLNLELSRLRQEAKNKIHQLQFEIKELSAELKQKTSMLADKDQTIATLMKHECKETEEQANRIDSAEKNVKLMEEKFNKMKNLYTNIREEHIGLLRKKGAVDKELTELKRVVEGQTEMGTIVEDLRKEKFEQETHFLKTLEEKDHLCEELESTVSQLKSQIEMVKSTNRQVEENLKSELDIKGTEMESFAAAKAALEESNKQLTNQLDQLSNRCKELATELSSMNSANNNYRSQIGELEVRIGENQRNIESEALQRYNELLNVCIAQNKAIVTKTIDDLENPLLTGGTGALDNFILCCRRSDSIVQLMKEATEKGYSSYINLKQIAEQLPNFTNHITNLMIHGSATSRTSADIQKGDEMLNDCRSVGTSVLDLMSTLKSRSEQHQLEGAYEKINLDLQKLLMTASSLGSSLTPEADASEVLDKELHAMELAIDEAAKKMEEMLSKSRADHTGIKLEVNEKLIDSCTELMNAIRLLVQRAKGLQKEIVSQGKGSASSKEFYKRNHQWTEGLISAAKAVGCGAKFLLESADKTVTNPGGGFELLIASSQDIAASTIQLVVASQVRADRSSSNLSLLKQASTGVKTATAHVVATAKDCAQLIEESDEMDVSKLSTHNAKKLELETQAEVLRLQSELEKSRMRLAALRQHHYHNSDG